MLPWSNTAVGRLLARPQNRDPGPAASKCMHAGQHARPVVRPLEPGWQAGSARRTNGSVAAYVRTQAVLGAPSSRPERSRRQPARCQCHTSKQTVRLGSAANPVAFSPAAQQTNRARDTRADPRPSPARVRVMTLRMCVPGAESRQRRRSGSGKHDGLAHPTRRATGGVQANHRAGAQDRQWRWPSFSRAGSQLNAPPRIAADLIKQEESRMRAHPYDALQLARASED